MKRILFIVHTQFNLLLCMQIKKSMFPNEEAHIILANETLRNVFERGELKRIFQEVYYYKEYDHRQSLFGFFNPQYEISRIMKRKYIYYTDIFFWNPDWIFYNFYKANCLNDKLKWHIYADAIGGYLTDVPDGFPTYGNSVHSKILMFLDKKIWKCNDILDLKRDYYISSPEFEQFIPTCEHISIPHFDVKDGAFVKLVNQIWGYEHRNYDEEIIYIDTGRGTVVDNETVNQSINTILSVVDKSNLLVKSHPSVDASVYTEKDLHFMKKDIPFELFALNGGLSGKTLICISSSAVLLQYVCFGNRPNVIATFEYDAYVHPLAEKLNELWRILSNQYNEVSIAKSSFHLVGLLKENNEITTT